MKGSGQFCPVSVASEIFAERWTPLISRELLAGETRFNAIRRGGPLMSRTLLARRLRELEDAGVVETRAIPGARAREYRLTTAGQEFRQLADALGVWGQRWGTAQFQEEHLDVGVLMWNVRRRIDRSRLPGRRGGVRLDGPRELVRAFPGWLLLSHYAEVGRPSRAR